MNNEMETMVETMAEAVTDTSSAHDVISTCCDECASNAPSTLSGIAIGAAGAAIAGGLVYGGYKLYKWCKKKLAERKSKETETEGEIVDVEFEDVKK